MPTIAKYLQKLKGSRFVKNLGITFTENVITKMLAFVVSLLLIRNLGPEAYGKYFFIWTNILLLSSLLDFGMENTAIRFYNRNDNLGKSVYGLYFLVKFAVIALFSILTLFSGHYVLGAIHKTELIPFIPVFIAGLAGDSLFFVNDTYLQAIQKFKFRALLNIFRYSLVLVFVLFLFLMHSVKLELAVYVFIVPLLFSLFFIPVYWSFVKSLFKHSIYRSLLTQIADYQKWMFSLAVANGLLGRVDIYMLSMWVSYKQLGIYSAAFNLTSIASFLPQVLGLVMLPKMAQAVPKELFKLTVDIVKPILALCGLILVMLPFAPWLINFLFGQAYSSAGGAFQLLLVAVLLSFLVLPFEHSLYSLGKPKYTAVSKYVQLVIAIGLNFVFIPAFGIFGAAWSIMLSRAIYACIILGLWLSEKKHYDSSSVSDSEVQNAA